MTIKLFSEEFTKDFLVNNFGKKYIHKKKIVKESNDIMSIHILNNILSMRSFWNNKNFKMILDKQSINYSDYSSYFLEHSSHSLRPDVNKVQNWIARGASIVLTEIDNLTPNLQSVINALQTLTNGKCQGNLYFSMESRQAFGPHADDHDVFAIHFEGEKVWNIYENVESNPINHPIFKFSAQEREKRAGKLIEQVVLKPGDLLYLPRGQYHDALASENGAIHIAFGLTYFKPIDLLSLFWEKFVLNEYMRSDFNKDMSDDNIKAQLKKMSSELSNVINKEENINLVFESIKMWPYTLNKYDLKQIMSKGKIYKVQKTIKTEKISNETFLTNGKDKVLIPNQYVEIINHVLKHEFINEQDILNSFKSLSKDFVLECINNLLNMKVLK